LLQPLTPQSQSWAEEPGKGSAGGSKGQDKGGHSEGKGQKSGKGKGAGQSSSTSGKGSAPTLTGPEIQEQIDHHLLLLNGIAETPNNEKLRNFIQGEIDSLNKKLTSASAAPEAQLQSLLKKQQKAKVSLQGKIKDLERLQGVVGRLKSEIKELLDSTNHLAAEISKITSSLPKPEDGGGDMTDALKRKAEELLGVEEEDMEEDEAGDEY
jgi:hypothetical protein